MSLPADEYRCRGRGFTRTRRYTCPDRDSCLRHAEHRADPREWLPVVWLMREPGRECEYMMREGE